MAASAGCGGVVVDIAKEDAIAVPILVMADRREVVVVVVIVSSLLKDDSSFIGFGCARDINFVTILFDLIFILIFVTGETFGFGVKALHLLDVKSKQQTITIT